LATTRDASEAQVVEIVIEFIGTLHSYEDGAAADPVFSRSDYFKSMEMRFTRSRATPSCARSTARSPTVRASKRKPFAVFLHGSDPDAASCRILIGVTRSVLAASSVDIIQRFDAIIDVIMLTLYDLSSYSSFMLQLHFNNKRVHAKALHLTLESFLSLKLSR
jgi:hypothetical protein